MLSYCFQPKDHEGFIPENMIKINNIMNIVYSGIHPLVSVPIPLATGTQTFETSTILIQHASCTYIKDIYLISTIYYSLDNIFCDPIICKQANIFPLSQQRRVSDLGLLNMLIIKIIIYIVY